MGGFVVERASSSASLSSAPLSTVYSCRIAIRLQRLRSIAAASYTQLSSSVPSSSVSSSSASSSSAPSATVYRCRIVYDTIVLGTIVLGTIVLGTIVLGTIVLSIIVLGTIVYGASYTASTTIVSTIDDVMAVSPFRSSRRMQQPTAVSLSRSSSPLLSL